MYITKGTRIRAHWLQANDPPSSLAGMQMKIGMTEKSVVGTITHVYGYADSKEDHLKGVYKKMTVMVKPDDGSAEIEVDQKHIVEVLTP